MWLGEERVTADGCRPWRDFSFRCSRRAVTARGTQIPLNEGRWSGSARYAAPGTEHRL